MKIMHNKINFEDLPHVVAELLDGISEIKSILKERQVEAQPTSKRVLLGIDEVCRITGKAKPTIYALVQKRLLPSYKRGKRLYFYEDEILAWIEGGKRETLAELHAKFDE